MEFVSKYQAKVPDRHGHIEYSAIENETWSILYQRMVKILPQYACQEHIDGLAKLQLNADRIPQLYDVSERLQHFTGWSVAPVPALIPLEQFFQLLANKQFPAATFIRTREDLDYVQEPDMFHEVFGHCPLLTDQKFADFTERYGQYALTMNEQDAQLLQRLYWFTVEFGLIKTHSGLRCYGGGILSSYNETQYALDSDVPDRLPLHDGIDALRTPYRIDEPQMTYFVLDDFDQLYHLLDNDPLQLLDRARQLGEYAPKFIPDPDNPNMHVRAC